MLFGRKPICHMIIVFGPLLVSSIFTSSEGQQYCTRDLLTSFISSNFYHFLHPSVLHPVLLRHVVWNMELALETPLEGLKQ